MSYERNVPVNHWPEGPDAAPPEQFVSQVKDALDNLYDPVYLQGHPLTLLLVPPTIGHDLKGARLLHQQILTAIEQLRPGDKVSRIERLWRTYRILQLRYVEALSFREVMSQLGLSQTHYHREQRRAVAALSSVLWEEHVAAVAARPRAISIPLPRGDLGKPLGLRILQAATSGTPTYE